MSGGPNAPAAADGEQQEAPVTHTADQEALPRDRLVEHEVREWREMKPPLKAILKHQEFNRQLKVWLKSYLLIFTSGVAALWAAKDAMPWVARQLLYILQHIVPALPPP